MCATLFQNVPQPNVAPVSKDAPRQIWRLGPRVDSWNETIDGWADKAGEVRGAFERNLAEHNIPYARASATPLTTAVFGHTQVVALDNLLNSSAGKPFKDIGGALTQSQERPYILVRDKAKTTVAVYVAAYGNDLYIGWTTFARRLWNIWALVIAIGLPALASIGNILHAIGDVINPQPSYFNPIPLSGWVELSSTILYFLLGVVSWFIIFMIIGWFLARKPLLLIRRNYNLFEETDAYVMARTIHKSLLHAADEVGIDSALLRKKDSFSFGSSRNLFM